MIKRDIYQKLWREDIAQKPMVFISGPRQAGKTTFANDILGALYPNKFYFNRDIIDNKKLLIENPYFFENVQRTDESKPLIIFDEIHKYKNWKSYLKGIYDKFSRDYHFIVSGSGRLDVSQKGGESLAGRCLSMHLFPLTLAELVSQRRTVKEFLTRPLSGFDINPARETQKIWENLSECSGFPEPFARGEKNFWVKWSQTYGRQIIREDLKTVSDIRRIDDIEILFSLLPSRIGSPVSVNNLAGDLQVSFDTVKEWLELFDHFYLTFRLSPWSKKISRSLLKEKKIYLFNYPQIPDDAPKFENMAALELLRAVSQWNEYGWGNFSLHYLRDKDKREVDFLIAQDNRPALLVETKYSDDTAAENLKYFQSVLHVPAVQLVRKENVFKLLTNVRQKILIVTAHRWLSSLP